MNSEALNIGSINLIAPKRWENILWGRVAPFFLLLYVGLNPFPHTTTIREVCYYTSLLLLVFYFAKYRDFSVFKSSLTIPVGLFTLWAFISLFWAIDIDTSIHDFRSHLVKYILLYCLLVVFINSKKKLRILSWIIVLSVVLSALNEMHTFYIVGGNKFTVRMAHANTSIPVGPMGFMALYASFFALLLFRMEKRLGAKIVLASCLGVLFFTLFVVQTRSILVAISFSIIALCWDNKKMLIGFVIISLLFTGIMLTEFRSWNNIGSYNDRLTINYMSLLLVKEHPIKGIGFGIDTPGNPDFVDHKFLKEKVPEKLKGSFPHFIYTSPHNMWLGLTIRTGVVGLFLFCVVIAIAIKECLSRMRSKMNTSGRLYAQLALSTIILFSIYGLFNVVFMHFLELLMCISFFIATRKDDELVQGQN